MEGGFDLGGTGRDAVEAAILDLERHRLPERRDLVVGPAFAKFLGLRFREILHQIEEARDRVAVGVVVAGEEIEVAVGLDRVGWARRDAEVALQAGVPIDAAVVGVELEIADDGIDQTIRAVLPVQEIAARADDTEARRLRDQLVAERPDLVGPALPDLHRPADRRRQTLGAEAVEVLHGAPSHLPEPLLAAVELVVGARQVARLHGGLVLLADHADQRARVRVDVADLGALVIERGIVDRDHADVVAPLAEDTLQLRQPDRRPYPARHDRIVGERAIGPALRRQDRHGVGRGRARLAGRRKGERPVARAVGPVIFGFRNTVHLFRHCVTSA